MDNPTAASLDTTSSNPSLQTLRADTALWWRIHVFLYDLRHFPTSPTSQTRLDTIVDPSYLGHPYFSADEVQLLRTLRLSPGATLADTIQASLDERLERRMKKRIESGDFRVCAAHDLAPVFERAFELSPKTLAGNEDFVRLVDENGLTMPEGWEKCFVKTRKCGPKQRPGKKKGQ